MWSLNFFWTIQFMQGLYGEKVSNLEHVKQFNFLKLKLCTVQASATTW